MAVKIGSARIDEHSKALGGKAGDQTGKEVSTQNWYNHSKGWKVFRAKNPAIAEKIAQDMQYACNNSNIGYDQSQRLTLYNVAQKVGFDCSKVTVKCETDCSALVRVCCAYAGVMLPNFRTPDEAKALINSGAFVEMTGSKYTDQSAYLMRGDILVTKTQGHTVIVLTNGSKATNNADPRFDRVYVSGRNVNIRIGAGTGFDIMGVVHKGDILPYAGEQVNNWYKITYKEKPGWISKKYSYLIN